jgi:hypothetical protein
LAIRTGVGSVTKSAMNLVFLGAAARRIICCI